MGEHPPEISGGCDIYIFKGLEPRAQPEYFATPTATVANLPKESRPQGGPRIFWLIWVIVVRGVWHDAASEGLPDGRVEDDLAFLDDANGNGPAEVRLRIEAEIKHASVVVHNYTNDIPIKVDVARSVGPAEVSSEGTGEKMGQVDGAFGELFGVTLANGAPIE